jgi:tRNA(Ile)-lysidine synthase
MTWLTSNGVDSENLDMGLVGSVERLIVGRSPNASLKVAGGRYVVREYDRLCIGKKPAAPRADFSQRLEVPGRILVVQAGLAVEAVEGRGVVKARGVPGRYPAKATISRKAVGRKSLTVRSWRPGDRMKPMGMSGRRKVKDILIDLKVPLPERWKIPVLECAGEIVWLPGYRVARGWEVGPGEESIGISIIEN